MDPFSKIDAARITKLDKVTFHRESGKPIYNGDQKSQRSRSRGTKTVVFLHSCECWRSLVDVMYRAQGPQLICFMHDWAG